MTEKILKHFSQVSVDVVSDIHPLKSKENTKKLLLLAKKKADPLKEFKALAVSCAMPYYSMDLISNCHLECTYCILQSYLANNPILTIYTDFENILERLTQQMKEIPEGSLIGTGRIADSLALEPLTGYANELIQFFSKQSRVKLELKTKVDHVDALLDCDHQGQTILSWSMAPEVIIKREEYKTSSLEERIFAMKKCAEAGYPIGIHMDPVILHNGWKKNYEMMLDFVFQNISESSIFWVSIGTLRFPMRQKRLMEKKFPKNTEILEGLQSSDKRFLFYPKEDREEIYQTIKKLLNRHLPEEKIFTCMEEYL